MPMPPGRKNPSGRLASRLMALCAAGVLAACATSTQPKLAGALHIHYPGLSQELGEEGTARVRLRYDAYGVVQEASIAQSSGSPSLDRAALASARQARIRPGTRYGVPQAGVVVLPVRFVLQD
ncbi:MAG: energy transducer TonB [Brachymonas sp.]|nr:energy transducer TonB [Brachymonas sp.]